MHVQIAPYYLHGTVLRLDYMLKTLLRRMLAACDWITFVTLPYVRL
jgi:hypothetical protein